MALKKKFPTDFGVEGYYWVVETLLLNFRQRVASIGIFGYLSEDASKNRARPMQTYSLSLAIDSLELKNAADYETACYNAMKEIAQEVAARLTAIGEKDAEANAKGEEFASKEDPEEARVVFEESRALYAEAKVLRDALPQGHEIAHFFLDAEDV